MSVDQTLFRLGGVASRDALRAEGLGDAEIDRALRVGTILPVRRGWYALPGADRAVLAAVRVGGSLTCVTLLRRSGVWVPRDDRLHVLIDPHRRRLAPAVVHWGSGGSPVDTIAGALARLTRCHGAEAAIAATDSALHQRLVGRADLDGVVPQRVLDRCDPSAEAGGESLLRIALARRRIAFRTQVPIDGVGRVDLLVGDRLVVEVDGYAFHGDRASFERDRMRDARLVRLGLLVLRVSYRQLESGEALEAILDLVRRDRHRLRSRAGGANGGSSAR